MIAGTSGALALLVTEEVEGRPLDSDTIGDTWAQVRILHQAGSRTVGSIPNT